MEGPEKPPERIRAAALRYQDRLFTGPTHAHALDAIQAEFSDFDPGNAEVESGFVTTTERFVDDVEAGKIALQAKQLKDRKTPELWQSGFSLDSTDVDLDGDKD